MQKLNLSEAEQELIKQDILHKEAELNRKMYLSNIHSSQIGGRRLLSETLTPCQSLVEVPLVKYVSAGTRRQAR
jgi:hypothetical protein